ncbi:recombinase family protein [Bacillus thuringiensis]|uniref:Recombinase family protein n=1 Tax=Bacillus thuringiensis TaxID=1428 RepID=A0ABD6SAK5_BACTU|nr:recombinase family protein [Bacillus thuringiensis]PER51663.1 recombinase family protein [Bacillus thuringiensis]PEU85813.1 recombinase family protein [Bacillus thuringiensis]PFI07561.1 recombinase family protein [Bacillus thuringiensis]PFW35653.1 recombinase family protein [Bacillus thuringiensis]PGY77917.1 recombinase family protein [Bacillus thuringiensis]
MGEKVVGYVRVSTEGQVREGYSLTYQVEEIERYCNENELQLLHIYEDKGISGATVDEDGLTVEREGLQELLSDMAYHQVGRVIVLNTSRLWRSDMAKVLIQRELKKHGVGVKAIEQPNYSIYTHDPNDFLVNGMLELLDQYQRLEIALKLSRGRKKKAEQGGYAGGGVMFGYTAKKGQKVLEVDAEKAMIVRRLFELRHFFRHWSLAQLAERLNVEGYRTEKGKLFTKVQVKDLIRIKNVLGLEISAIDLLKGSKNLPYILVERFPYGKAKKLIGKLAIDSTILSIETAGKNS